jgi:hypothetical protein
MLLPAAGANPASEATALTQDATSNDSIRETAVRARDRPNP